LENDSHASEAHDPTNYGRFWLSLLLAFSLGFRLPFGAGITVVFPSGLIKTVLPSGFLTIRPPSGNILTPGMRGGAAGPA